MNPKMNQIAILFCERRVWNSVSVYVTSAIQWFFLKWESILKYYFQAIGTLSAFATLIAFISSQANADFFVEHSLSIILAINVISIFFIYSQMKTSKSLTLCMRPQLKVNIREKDLFSENGIISIPVNEYFDTIVDDKIISSKSVHGLFVKKYLSTGKTLKDLDAEIARQLAANGSKKVKGPANRPRGNQQKYQLGTCVDIQIGECTYVLFAFSRFDSDNHASVNSMEVPTILNKLLAHLFIIAADRTVSIPLFGTGLSRLNRSHKRTLLFLLDSIEYMCAEEYKFPGGLNIDIYDIGSTDINLDDIETVFKTNIY